MEKVAIIHDGRSIYKIEDNLLISEDGELLINSPNNEGATGLANFRALKNLTCAVNFKITEDTNVDLIKSLFFTVDEVRVNGTVINFDEMTIDGEKFDVFPDLIALYQSIGRVCPKRIESSVKSRKIPCAVFGFRDKFFIPISSLKIYEAKSGKDLDYISAFIADGSHEGLLSSSKSQAATLIARAAYGYYRGSEEFLDWDDVAALLREFNDKESLTYQRR